MSIGPTQDTITLCLSAATDEQLRAAARAIDEELDKRASVIMNALEDPDGLLNQGLADFLDTKELGLPTGEPIQLMLQRQTKWTPQRVELALTPLPRETKEWVPPSADIVMSELEDPDSLLNQGLADALDARELDVVEVRPVLYKVPARVGKGALPACLRICAKNPHDDALVLELTAGGRDAPFWKWAVEVESRAKLSCEVERKLTGMRLGLRSWYNLYIADFSPKEAIEQLISEW